jgi:type III restriction enzyme
MTLIASERGWTVAKLANWIDQSVDHPDVTAEESGIWLVRVIQGLIDQGGLGLDQLVHDKYRLRTAIDLKLKDLRSARKKAGFQTLLGTRADSPVVVDSGLVFKFSSADYPCSNLYTGNYEFKKHYYRKVGSLNDEELACAQFLDSREEVDFWVRNLDRQPESSFWLPTSTDRFYPDFVASLKDGRRLVVEYKGQDRWSTDDSKEKRNIGAIWEERSEGRCLFIMPQGPDFASILGKMKSP